MNLVLIIIILAIFCIFAYLASAAILTQIIKLFKVENVSFKKSLVVILLSVFLGMIAGIVFIIINLGIVSSILFEITIFLIFYYLLKKYYSVDWKKSLGIYIAFNVVVVILSLIIVVPVRAYIVQPFFVNGDSMSPNYNQSDYLLVGMYDKQIKREDVVVYHNPKSKNQILIKRIVGLPGEKVEIKNGQILINSKVLEESYAIKGETLGEVSLILGNDEYFILGDNRVASLDSRLHGAIKSTDIIGKVIYNFKAPKN